MVLWMGPILLCYNFCFQNALKQVGFTKQTVSKVTDIKYSIEAEDHCYFEAAISPYTNFTKELRTTGLYQTYCMKSSLLIHQGHSEDTTYFTGNKG